MIRRMIGLALVVLADMGLIIGLTADALGLGEGHAIGYKQILFVVGSLVLQLIGIVLTQVNSPARTNS